MKTNLYETYMAMRDAYVKHVATTSDTRLAKYIERRNKRTGQTWRVVKRYTTPPSDYPSMGWDRAIIENEHGKRVRIFDYGRYWRVS